MKWVTRARPGVDRIACPWLIMRHIDADAEILYVAPDRVMAVAEEQGATPFDVPGVELGHHGDECSFDAIVKTYGLHDPAIARMALIVRGADTAAASPPPESAGLKAIGEGFRLAYDDDHAQLAAELPLYDALYAWCQAQGKAEENLRSP
jgi:hypothetical protein